MHEIAHAIYVSETHQILSKRVPVPYTLENAPNNLLICKLIVYHSLNYLADFRERVVDFKLLRYTIQDVIEYTNEDLIKEICKSLAEIILRFGSANDIPQNTESERFLYALIKICKYILQRNKNLGSDILERIAYMVCERADFTRIFLYSGRWNTLSQPLVCRSFANTLDKMSYEVFREYRILILSWITIDGVRRSRSNPDARIVDVVAEHYGECI